jgi:hypothetical protein
MGLMRGLPEMAFDPNAGGMQVVEWLWPLVREMSRILFADQVGYVFEGELLSRHVAGLRAEYATQVTADGAHE